MDRHRHGRGSAPEFRLSQTSAREVVGRTGPPRVREQFLSTDHLSIEAAAAYAATLIAGGYALEGVTPVDQFRYSAHVELVGVFRQGRKG